MNPRARGGKAGEPKKKGQYIVEAILNKRERGGRAEYLLKWKNHPESENSWEPEDNLNCSDLLEKYNKRIREMQQQKPVGSVEAIIGAAKINNEMFYLVKYHGNEQAEFLPTKVLSKSHPQLIVEFYEQRYSDP